MGIVSASVVVVSLTLAYILYVRRPAPEPLRQGFHEFLFSGLYLDRLYQVIFVGPYQRMAEFLKGQRGGTWYRSGRGDFGHRLLPPILGHGQFSLAQG